MSEHKVFQMSFAKIYDQLLNKAVRKGRTKSEVDEIVCWLTGYSESELDYLRGTDTTYGDFFRMAPRPNLSRVPIEGAVCEVWEEEVEVPPHA